MAQGVGSVLGGPVAALLHDATGSWMPVFASVIAMDIAHRAARAVRAEADAAWIHRGCRRRAETARGGVTTRTKEQVELLPALSVLKDSHFLQGNETAAHHLFELGQKGLDLLLAVDDLDHDRQVFG